MRKRLRRPGPPKAQQRTPVERGIAELRAEAHRCRRLRQCEVAALEKGLRNLTAKALLESAQQEVTETELSSDDRTNIRNALPILLSDKKDFARDLLAVFRGDRRLRDEPMTTVYAAAALRDLGTELVPELADSGATYETTDQGIRHAVLVSAGDVTREAFAAAGTLLTANGL